LLLIVRLESNNRDTLIYVYLENIQFIEASDNASDASNNIDNNIESLERSSSLS